MVFAQYGYNTSTLTIDVKGNRNTQVWVDGRSYSANDRYDNQRRERYDNLVTINGLQPGQHSLRVMIDDYRHQDNRNRNNRNDRRNQNDYNNITTFNLRAGYDMEITVNANGTLRYKESKIKNRKPGNNNNGGYNNGYRYAMPEANFNQLLRDIRGQWLNGSRINAINTAFANSGNSFSVTQAKQLIILVSGENERLGLAKASLPTLVDLNNISYFNDLFSSQYSRDELNNYARNYR